MYKKNKHIHFMGIGGIGMSGIAAVLRQQGYPVSGCDLASHSSVLDWLESLGCTIYTGHDAAHVANADVLVYSSAVNMNDPEMQAALKKGIPVIPRANMLAELMRMKYGIAVAGAHGKTTTTSMISHIISEAKLDPTIIIGGVLKNLSTHAKLGRGDLLIAEADESDRSLLYLNPSMAIVTNIDAEHLDTYKDLDDIKQTFKNFLARLPFYGKAFLCVDDPNLRSILPLPHIQTVKYGLSSDANIRGEIIELAPEYSVFKVFQKVPEQGESLTFTYKELGQIKIIMPGDHNVLNALAATALALELDIPFVTIKAALESLSGVERRFEFKGTFNGAEIFDDYGHHPTEIQKVLAVAQRRARKKLHVVFQPHRFTRTEKLWEEFVATFAWCKVDSLFITDIYPASEQPIAGITAERLVEAIRQKNPQIPIHYCSSYEEITRQVEPLLQKDDLFITIGAGKANTIGKALVEKALVK